MPLDYQQLMTLAPRVTRQRYDTRDTILYALGIGAGACADELHFVYEADLRAIPTMAVVLAYPGFWLKDATLGLDWRRILHGEQMLELHGAIPVAGEIVSELTIDEVYDKGIGKGAILLSTRRLSDAASGELLATVRQSSVLRGDGGSGGNTGSPARPAAVPANRPADRTIDLPTRPEQALIYRLLGDDNPLHADPETAARAGFRQPILHGLCTYGVAARAVLKAWPHAGSLRHFDARFTSPVYPGETIRTEVWLEPNGAAFRASVVERAVIVLNGRAGFDRPQPCLRPEA